MIRGIRTGTNFYIIKKCWWCGNVVETHIGKSSVGWKFLFQINDEYEPNINSLWEFLKWKKIEDEYHHKISRDELFKFAYAKQKGESNELSTSIDTYGFEWSTVKFS